MMKSLSKTKNIWMIIIIWIIIDSKIIELYTFIKVEQKAYLWGGGIIRQRVEKEKKVKRKKSWALIINKREKMKKVIKIGK